ncbi:hypothetical protein ALC57_10761 [Trachymyrmex cornetzi]|uniref:Uncharacterized protein n=1 Tax=Trachymyrmex cornetzi TaxID=471704 RepID=A0A151J3I1_9HYME|nr:hypothetical protein ALC57_10761 [Trachymyrmex cornetzi]
MHPWLAGAQYRTTAVVLVYRLISLIGPHCPASTYFSTCPSLSMHFVVHSREKERGNVGGVRRREKELERDKLRACVCIHGRRCSAIGALFAKYLPGYHEYNAAPQKFVHATVKRRANKRFSRVEARRDSPFEKARPADLSSRNFGAPWKKVIRTGCSRERKRGKKYEKEGRQGGFKRVLTPRQGLSGPHGGEASGLENYGSACLP